MSAAVIITGASSGIGRALALAWAARGARVALSARNATALDQVADEVRRAGGQALAVPSDVTIEASRQELVARTLETFGGLDVLVNNAGRGYYTATVDIEPDELEALYRLNVVAPVRLAGMCIEPLARARGAVVMISSVAGVVSTPRIGAYASSKFALEALAAAMRAEVASRGVRVLVVRPGPVATPFHEHAVIEEGGVGYRPPGRRRQQPEEVAAQTLHALDRERDVLETSLFVKVGSAAARVVPGLMRRVSRAMAKKSGF